MFDGTKRFGAKWGVGSGAVDAGSSEMWLDFSLFSSAGCSALGGGDGERGCVLDVMVGAEQDGEGDARRGREGKPENEGVYVARSRMMQNDQQASARPDCEILHSGRRRPLQLLQILSCASHVWAPRLPFSARQNICIVGCNTKLVDAPSAPGAPSVWAPAEFVEPTQRRTPHVPIWLDRPTSSSCHTTCSPSLTDCLPYVQAAGRRSDVTVPRPVCREASSC